MVSAYTRRSSISAPVEVHGVEVGGREKPRLPWPSATALVIPVPVASVQNERSRSTRPTQPPPLAAT